jgi:hypothetical protein
MEKACECGETHDHLFPNSVDGSGGGCVALFGSRILSQSSGKFRTYPKKPDRYALALSGADAGHTYACWRRLLLLPHFTLPSSFTLFSLVFPLTFPIGDAHGPRLASALSFPLIRPPSRHAHRVSGSGISSINGSLSDTPAAHTNRQGGGPHGLRKESAAASRPEQRHGRLSAVYPLHCLRSNRTRYV